MKSKFFAFFVITLLGLVISLNTVGCKKDKMTDEQTMEDTEEDMSADENAEDME